MSREFIPLINVSPRFLSLILTKTAPQRSKNELNMTQEKALMFIADNPGASHRKVWDEISMNKGAFSRLIREMVNMGLIREEKDKQDKRLIRLHLTAEGESMTAEFRTRLSKNFDTLCSYLDEDEIDALFDSLYTLKKITEKLERDVPRSLLNG